MSNQKKQFDIKALDLIREVLIVSFYSSNSVTTELELATRSVKVIGIAEELIKVLQLDDGRIFQRNQRHGEVHRQADAGAIANGQGLLFLASFRLY